MKGIKETLLSKIEDIDDEQQLAHLLSVANELSKRGNTAEPNVAYDRKDDFSIPLTEDQIIGLAEGLQDIRMGKVHAHEEVMNEMKELLKNYK
ncbi:MAG TPA: hypothetical protein PL009_06545 [Flavipsychrobacter sp.]|nr:hypothetical protein [Flavipsychrobacter sp.]